MATCFLINTASTSSKDAKAKLLGVLGPNYKPVNMKRVQLEKNRFWRHPETSRVYHIPLEHEKEGPNFFFFNLNKVGNEKKRSVQLKPAAFKAMFNGVACFPVQHSIGSAALHTSLDILIDKIEATEEENKLIDCDVKNLEKEVVELNNKVDLLTSQARSMKRDLRFYQENFDVKKIKVEKQLVANEIMPFLHIDCEESDVDLNIINHNVMTAIYYGCQTVELPKTPYIKPFSSDFYNM